MKLKLRDVFFRTSCQICGVPPIELCQACNLIANPGWVNRFAFPVFKVADYTPGLEKVIKGYKDASLVALEPHLAELVAGVLQHLPLADIELVLTPARSPANFKKRGFDPADEIIKRALKLAGFKIAVQRFSAVKKRLDQRGLSLEGRERNLSGSFFVNRSTATRVLLFDDVLTTGATLREMHRAAVVSRFEVLASCVLAQTISKK